MTARHGARSLPVATLRVLGVVALACAVLVGSAGPAAAHGRGVEAGNYDSVVTEAPDVQGIEVRTLGGDELLEITTTGPEVVVEGYDGEPYLRLTPDGVEENAVSPARWLNEERYRTELPAEADVDPDAAPQWELVTNRPGWAWHDHRTHFMSMSLPPAVEAAPDEPHLIQEWEVPLQVDGAREAVTGELRWVPGPSPWPWLAFGLAVPLVGLAGLSRRHQPGRGLVAPAVVVLGAVVVLNVTRLVDDVFALPLPTGEVVLAAGQTALFLAIAALGLVKAWRGGDGAYTALAVASGAILVGQGLLYVDVLSASQIASLLPGDFGRAVAALSIGQAVPSAVIAWVGSRQQVPADHEPVHDPTPAST